ncbi:MULTISPECIES: sulfate reduction electron transfer complex DsrMKJOP subunit DsrJ [unclassified Desulfovibrio]|uniref:sulfate reduction electron transfer complex DsrMKJOP subunit DsrJ n=1 Tax=unclassified Desulfovibrio TaxID=2593640 RepID=UPI0013EB05FA|nr:MULTISPECIES: sulfate reduction electron transfer complex DsrMKJOP subunit DsrJ [unclassified Desulfovibrio]MBD5626059.1 sulfate reduction electron transfer complex DsrMKJOP subunit DsrJ [Desulfovibrio sp.]MDE6734644.1 sulfate reduction electron transfer complex DsrMKJOP subunit DsrJ [Desulfovibrio sp.]MDE7370249.1 sulfate reduction electron transfer complex DsrMKJOP subunit DsrJ [Desulfovibrio sp.]
MYNAKAVIIGIVIFVAVFSSPFWTSWIGQDYTKTGVVLPAGEKQCIEDTEFMRAQHMRLLDEWRDQALREENRVYESALNGKKWVISLQNTCLKCHSNYAEFCEKCHVANSVYPYCWTCHIIPTEGKR